MASPPRPDEVLASLRQVEIFAELDEQVLRKIATLALPRRYAKGELLFMEGDPGDCLIILVSGVVSVFRTSPSGERAGLAQLEPPDVLGEVALLDGQTRSASVEASTPTLVLALPRRDFMALLQTQPVALESLLKALGLLVRRLSDQASDHIFLDLSGRVAKTLLRLAPQATPQAPAPVRTVSITQGRLAEMCGGTRQSVNQVLRGFSQRSMVELEGRRVLLTDVAALRRRAQLPEEDLGRRG
ncbi:MAG: Crp/Fnr family transcriptional regulator [Actinomycetota bacterium]|nr:Crp/Fnr family transcriptional regulator [Actinomycetota bacterium]